VDRRAKLLTQHILQTHGSVRLKDLSDRFFLGQRTIQRLVQNTIGVNYKFFARIARLEYVRQLLSRSNCSLTDVALRAGYFDQAHFIHDFQETFGESPGQYLARQRRQQLIWNQLDTYRALPETG
jgi:AraC-like DNA-binding protein